MEVVYDIETNGLLDSVSQVHCIATEELKTGIKKIFFDSALHHVKPSGTLLEGIEYLNKADKLIGHNVLGYDNIVLERFYGDKFKPKEVIDTLLLSKFIYPDIKQVDFKLAARKILPTKYIGRHSLEAWGYRLKEYKGEFGKEADWNIFTDEMAKYCQQDVTVNCKIYMKLMSKNPAMEVFEWETELKKICMKQEEFGFPFDTVKAQELLKELSVKRIELLEKIKNKLGGIWIVGLEEKTPKRTLRYNDATRGSYTEGATYTKIKIIEFNPQSRSHIGKRLQEVYKWKPKEYGKDGNPTIDEKVLSKLKFPVVEHLMDYLTIEKRLGQLATGRRAWIDLEKDGKIHGHVDTIGAVTFRCSHKNPNLAQIPSVNSPYGKETRELFKVEDDELLMGCDVSGLELRMLGHYMSRYDNGEYAEEVINGDIHTRNQKAAGLPTRDNAKTFIYGFLYGAGDEKIGEIIHKGRQEGRRMRLKFLKEVPALKHLIDAVQSKADQGYIKGLDKRLVPVRAKYAALNTLLQSAGAIVCKRWVVNFHKAMAERGYIHGIHYKQAAFVHDELQVRFKKKYFPVEDGKSIIGEIAVQTITQTGEELGVRVPLTGDYSIGKTYADTH